MKTATSSVEFSFNNIMYRQIDGVATGSPLGPALENIFVGYYESKLFKKISKPTVATDDAPSCEVPSRRRTIKPPAWQKNYYMF